MSIKLRIVLLLSVYRQEIQNSTQLSNCNFEDTSIQMYFDVKFNVHLGRELNQSKLFHTMFLLL